MTTGRWRWAGFTGTRHVPPARMAELITEEMINELGDFSTFVTGGCRGFDAFMGALLMMRYPEHDHQLILPANRSQVEEWWKWPSVAPLVRNNENFFIEEMRKDTSYRDRNARIVGLSDAMHVFADYPEDHPKSRRSGTWMTKRIAEASDIPFGWIITANK